MRAQLKGWRAAGEELGARDMENKGLELPKLPSPSKKTTFAELHLCLQSLLSSMYLRDSMKTN